MNEPKNVKFNITSVEQHKSDFSDLDAEKPTIKDWNNCHTNNLMPYTAIDNCGNIYEMFISNGEKSICVNDSIKPYYEETLEGFIQYCKDRFGVELVPKESANPDTVEKLFHVMRESTPEEQEAMNKVIRDMSYDTGVTLQGLLDHETYVPMSKIDKAIDLVDEYICNKEKNTYRAQGMCKALELIEQYLKEHDYDD